MKTMVQHVPRGAAGNEHQPKDWSLRAHKIKHWITHVKALSLSLSPACVVRCGVEATEDISHAKAQDITTLSQKYVLRCCDPRMAQGQDKNKIAFLSQGSTHVEPLSGQCTEVLCVIFGRRTGIELGNTPNKRGRCSKGRYC